MTCDCDLKAIVGQINAYPKVDIMTHYLKIVIVCSMLHNSYIDNLSKPITGIDSANPEQLRSHNSCPGLNQSKPVKEFIVYFMLSSSQISKDGKRILSAVSDLVSNLGSTKVLIVGHADQRGSPEFNLRLAKQRAVSVLVALKDVGVSSSILEVDWKGEFEPAVPVDDDDLEAKNRRVVIQVFR